MGDPRELRSRGALLGSNGRRRQRSKSNFSLLAGDFAAENFSSKSGAKKLRQSMSSSDTSPDSKCPICLDRFENVAYLDHCWHQFCFRCVQEWSKNKAECPLCKQPFHSIVHSMRSEDDYKVYTVKPSETDSFGNPDGRRFRYRTTLTRERRASGYPRRNSASRRTVPPPDNGILFEGLSGQTTRQRDAEISQMIRRLQSRRQASMEGRSMRQIQEQDIINFRRALYRSGTRVRSIEDGGRYRDISAEFFRRNPACLHRLVPWLKRELTVLFGAHGSLVNIVQHIIMSNVTRYDLESPAFADELKPFLLHRTEHFLHEFINFARCPFNIEAYDQHANYDCPAPSYEEGSRSESSIITISPDDASSQEAEHNAFTADIGQDPWDDETPGPSYLSSDQVRMVLALDTSESSEEEPSTNTTDLQAQLPTPVEMNGDSCDSSDNCIMVGYVKPLAERTPELVELSSDSEASVENGNREDLKPVKPMQYLSFSDTDASGYASPFSIGSRNGSASHTGNMAASNERKSKRRDKDKSKSRELAWLQSSPTERENCDYNLPKSRKSDFDAQYSHRERHGLKSKQKHHRLEKHKRKRDGTKHKHRKDKKRSRTHEKNLSGRSQAFSPSSESTGSRGRSTSRSHSNDYSKTSKSKENDDYFRNSCKSKYKWEYSRNTSLDGYEYRRRASYWRQSPSPDYTSQPFSERRKSRNPRGHSRGQHYYHERYRSRSRSSNRSHTPSRRRDRTRSEKPSGKRKYKTRHLENAHRGNEESSSMKEGSTFGKLLPKYKRSASFLDSQLEADASEKKRKKTSRSPSVEIIYEGQATDTARHHKRKKRKEKKPIKSHLGSSPVASPVVITIDSDSDKTPDIQDNTEWDSSVSWSPAVPQHEREAGSPSPLLEARDSSCDRVGEPEDEKRDRTLTTSTRDIGDEPPNAIDPLQDRENNQTPGIESSPSIGAGHQLSNGQRESIGQLPKDTMSLLLRLRERLTDHSHPLDNV